MTQRLKIGISLAVVAFFLAAGAATAQQRNDHAGSAAAPRPAMPRAEPHPGPKGYQRVTEPKGWNARPRTVNRVAYQHNYQAARSYKIGPYHAPAGWTANHWAYGQMLPRAYWASQYILSDYWLFALEVPPAGYEWVRDGSDAILVNVNTGEILQVEYGVFA
jgi:Ni/Co efflux regulator RcnB